MKQNLVTGVAGFIGSQLAEQLLDAGERVVGVDVLTDYYDVDQKRDNLAALVDHPNYEHVEADVVDVVDEVVDGIDVVYHQAGQPGVRASWREQFDDYLHRNVRATQRLLESSLRAGVGRVVYASSSSVYGNADEYPVTETSLTKPHSPYGVTKLAAEHLCTLYAANFGLSTVSLRYFTVYGPRQRPDMATHRLFQAALGGTPFPLFGTGEQVRDFTYVGDVVRANVLAGAADVPDGLVANIAGGSSCSMLELIADVERIVGEPIELDRLGSEKGDVTRTSALTDRAHDHLAWEPVVPLSEGLGHQHRWHAERRAVA